MPITTSTEVYLMEVLLNLTGPMDVDWNAVMSAIGFGSEGGTRNKFGSLKKEFLAAKVAGTLPTVKTVKSINSAPATPNKTTKRKATTDEDGSEAVKAPKTPKTPRTKKLKVEKEVSEEDFKAEATD